MVVWWYGGMVVWHASYIHRSFAGVSRFLVFTPSLGHALLPSATQFYGFARTNNQKGITIPSQRRFIYYWHQMLLDTNHYEDGEDEDGESVRGSIMARRSSAFIGVDMETLKQAVETVMPEVCNVHLRSLNRIHVKN